MADTLHSPKGMWTHSREAMLPAVNVVYCFNNSSILICRNLDFKSRHEKWPVLTKLSSASWILGNRYESFFMQVLRCQNYMKNCRLPSFFWNSTTALHHRLWWGWIVPESNICHRCLWTFSTSDRGICLNHSLNGASSLTLITCSVEWVQKSFQGSKEKMSLY